MTFSSYRLEWSYLTELPDTPGPYKYADEAHCEFLIRFLDLPRGPDHCAFLSINVVTVAKAVKLGVESRRAYLVADNMTREDFREHATRDVVRAFDALPRREALARLNEQYVWRDQDFRDEFRADALRVDELRELIEEAFAGVTRGEGVTLHEALARDDYANPEQLAAARARDEDTDWHDVNREVMAAHCEFFSYLDAAGYCYYLPAAMLLSLDADACSSSSTPQRTYWSLLPGVAPRDFGKGLGQAFDSEVVISTCGFTAAQVRAIYRFACYMAISADEGVDEEQLPSLRKWRASAARRGDRSQGRDS